MPSFCFSSPRSSLHHLLSLLPARLIEKRTVGFKVWACLPLPHLTWFSVPLSFLHFGTEPEIHATHLETSLGLQGPLGPTDPLLLCVLWENRASKRAHANICKRDANKMFESLTLQTLAEPCVLFLSSVLSRIHRNL